MAYIIGTLRDKRGNVLSNLKVIARIAVTDPTGDTGNDYTDALGNYKIAVANTGTVYNLYINNEAGGTSGSNYMGQIVSSGDAVTSFVLGTDATFKQDHYGSGEAETAGTHKSIRADHITLRTLGKVRTTDTYLDFSLSTDTIKLRIAAVSADGVMWLSGNPMVGCDDYELGIKEAYDGTHKKLYFGSAKTYYVKSDGSFILGIGAFPAAIAASAAWTITGVFTFNKDMGYPKLNTYAPPTIDTQFTPKKYVDDQLAAAALTSANYWKNPVKVLFLIGDEDMAGYAPESVYTGDCYVANNWGVGYTDDHLYEYNGVSWVDLGIIDSNTRCLIVEAGAVGSFAGYENYIASYDGTTWTFTAPVDGWVVQIRSGYYKKGLYTYDSGLGYWDNL